MKKSYMLPLLTIAALAGLALSKSADAKVELYAKSHLRYSSGPPAGRTGAPGESSCVACHTGSAQNGDAINIFEFEDADGNVVTSYLPGETYNVNFTIDNPAARKGFEATALAAVGNAAAGTFAGSSTTSLTTNAGRKYVSHNSSSNMTTTGWDFQWTAPASNVGAVKFYVASNVTNSNNNDTGDMIYTSNITLPYGGSSASLSENKQDIDLSAGYAASTNTINLQFNSRIAGDGFVNLVDMNGRSVFSAELNAVNIGSNAEKVLLPADVKNGIYIVHLFVNNQSSTHKLMIQK